MKNKYYSLLILALIFSSAAFFQSCDSGTDGVTGPVNNNMDFSFKAKDSTINYTGSDVIVIDSAKMLIKDVTIQGQFGGNNDLKMGTTVVYLDPNNGFSPYIGSLIPNSQYVSLNYSLVSKTTDDGITDPDFATGVSFVIKGKFNGLPFVYSSRAVSQNYTLTFPENLRVVTDLTHVTVTYNPKFWFRMDTDESIIVDPFDTTPGSKDLIDYSFRSSLSTFFSYAFKDDNQDGLPD